MRRNLEANGFRGEIFVLAGVGVRGYVRALELKYNKKPNTNGENRRISTSKPTKYEQFKSGGTVFTMSPLVFYSLIPKCDSLFIFTK